MNDSPTEQAIERIRRLPKVSLHCHLEGCVRPATLLELSLRNGVDLGLAPDGDPADLYHFADFGAFLRRVRDVCRVLTVPADYGRIAKEYIEDALHDGICYAELFLSPAAWQRLHPHLDLRLAMEEIAKALAQGRQHGLEVAVIVDLTRNFGPLIALETCKLALAWRDLGVIGLGLGGDEVGFPAPLFTEAFDRGRQGGLRCVAHAGEAAGAQSVRETVEMLRVERIGHGIRAAEDPWLLADLARRGIACEQSPSSNSKTGIVSSLADHPIGECVAAGIRVAVDADDPAMFGTTISQELALLEGRFGRAFVGARLFDAIAVSFAQESHRVALVHELQHALFKDMKTRRA